MDTIKVIRPQCPGNDLGYVVINKSDMVADDIEFQDNNGDLDGRLPREGRPGNSTDKSPTGKRRDRRGNF